MSVLQRLQKWFMSQCNGDWEHAFGIRIATIDNPGWGVDIDIEGTELVGISFQPLRAEGLAGSWLHVWKDGLTFKIRCSPEGLEKGIEIFCDWAERSGGATVQRKRPSG